MTSYPQLQHLFIVRRNYKHIRFVDTWLPKLIPFGAITFCSTAFPGHPLTQFPALLDPQKTMLLIMQR